MTIHSERFECRVDGHNKWWSYEYDDVANRLVTRWGSLLNGGEQSNIKRLVTPTEVDKLVKSKKAKGYKRTVSARREDPPAVRDSEEIIRKRQAMIEAEREMAVHGFTLVQSLEWVSQRIEGFKQRVEVAIIDRTNTVKLIEEFGYFHFTDYYEAAAMADLLNNPPHGGGYLGDFSTLTVRGLRIVSG